MARNTKAKKKPKNITLTNREVEKIKKDATAEAVKITSRLAVAVMAQNHKLTEDEIFKDMQDISRWAQAIDKHYLSIKEIDEIIEKMGGVKFLNF